MLQGGSWREAERHFSTSQSFHEFFWVQTGSQARGADRMSVHRRARPAPHMCPRVAASLRGWGVLEGAGAGLARLASDAAPWFTRWAEPEDEALASPAPVRVSEAGDDKAPLQL